MTRREFVTGSEAETTSLGYRLGRRLPSGAVVLLEGELGVGKTAFVRGLAAGLGASEDDVSSPTFTLVQEYRGGRLPLLHADLYRLDGREADDLGLDELGRDGVVAVEWGDKLQRPPDGSLRVLIVDLGGDSRRVALEGPDALVVEAAAGPPFAL
ncbi:MAG TPA: tRNA (adenosine(37)-N6)-threonylcarbamoyltransferase complex ATPase subunit type 1 TsaE [Vicinamibacterales bacterium]|nr:tRNA (adenosine(37)-N6)-threonylcarbamoyltransferase complex ATPase subunit type 1 TsaE [Vicinamibacterales bacterium]